MVPARLMVRDLTTGTLTTLPTDNGNVAEGEVTGVQFGISPDGERVAFVSTSSSLVAGDNNGRADVFVMQLSTGASSIASSASNGTSTTGGGIFWRLSFVSRVIIIIIISYSCYRILGRAPGTRCSKPLPPHKVVSLGNASKTPATT